MNVQTKRAYEKASSRDGIRVLVDRLWPRGLSKDEARIDVWAKDLAPSTGLRKWFDHDPGKWPEFKKRYFKELENQREALNGLLEKAGKHPVTLVYGARQPEFNNARALKEYIESSASRKNKPNPARRFYPKGKQ